MVLMVPGWPAVRSRTVPTKLVTAPTPPSPARSAATSADRSKSSVWMCTRGVGAMAMFLFNAGSAGGSAAGHRREEGHLGAGRHRRGLVGHHLVQCAAQCAAAGQRFGMAATACDQRITQLAQRGGGRQLDGLRGAQQLAQRGEVAHGDGGVGGGQAHAQAPINEDNSSRRTVSPRRTTWPDGLSTRPSAHTAEASTPELWLGNSSTPPWALKRARKNSRRLSGWSQSKSARTCTACGIASVQPCNARSTGATASRKVTKLDTGLPGRPMNSASLSLSPRRTAPKTSGLPGFIATCQASSQPSALTARLMRSEEHTSELQ